MASKKKKRREINPPEVIPSSSKDTNDYHESFDHPSWDNERKWAEEIMDSITRHSLNYACLFLAVLQQMNRRKVFLEATDEGQNLAEFQARGRLKIFVYFNF